MRLRHSGKNVVIVLALLAAGFFVAYLRFRPYLGQESTYTDGEKVYATATSEDIRYAVWTEPRPLPGFANSEAWEGHPTVSPDGRLLVFAVGELGLNAELYVADLVNGEALDPRPLRGINTDADEWAPAFSGDSLYFASNREGTRGGLDLYRAPYEEGLFGPAETLGAGINTPATETDPAPIPGSEAVAFASNRKRGQRDDYDLYFAVPRLAGADAAAEERFEVEPLANLNTPWDEREPAFVSDGGRLLFASDREGGFGGFDLFRSVRDRGVWLAPEPLFGVNTALNELGPSPSRDGFTLLFSVEEGPGDSNLFRARSRELFRVPGRPVGWWDLAILASLLILALLAWLAKRWESLEIIYKCFLVSLLVHLLIMLWFRDVFMEPGLGETPGRKALFKVRLSSQPRSVAMNQQERNGRLETARAESAESAEQLQRNEAQRASASPSSAPARSLQRSSLARAEDGPQNRFQSVSQPAQTAPSEVAIATEQPTNAFEALRAEAPSMQLQATEASASSRVSENASSNPDGRRATERVAAGEQRPDARALARGASAREQTPQAREAGHAPTMAQESGAALANAVAVNTANPNEALQRHSGAAPALALNAQSSDMPAAQEGQRPDRGERADVSLPQADPSAGSNASLSPQAAGLTQGAPLATAGPRQEQVFDPTPRSMPEVSFGEATSEAIPLIAAQTAEGESSFKPMVGGTERNEGEMQSTPSRAQGTQAELAAAQPQAASSGAAMERAADRAEIGELAMRDEAEHQPGAEFQPEVGLDQGFEGALPRMAADTSANASESFEAAPLAGAVARSDNDASSPARADAAGRLEADPGESEWTPSPSGLARATREESFQAEAPRAPARFQPGGAAMPQVAMNLPGEESGGAALAAAETAETGADFEPLAMSQASPSSLESEGPARSFEADWSGESESVATEATPLAFDPEEAREWQPESRDSSLEAFEPSRRDWSELAVRDPNESASEAEELAVDETWFGPPAPPSEEFSLLAWNAPKPPHEPELEPRRWLAEQTAMPDSEPGFNLLAMAEAPVEAFAVSEPALQWEHTPYRNRFGAEKEKALELHGGSKETERAVAAGLAYLASRQTAHGHWGSHDKHEKYREVMVGKTGLAMLAFLGAGHTHTSDTEYSGVVKRAIDYFIAAQNARNGHFGDSSSYGHGIATYALAECYALTEDEALKPVLRRAVSQILRHQNGNRRDPRRFGGWAYYYPDNEQFDSWPRVSITAWQVMALESARLGGISVPDRTFEDAKAFLRNAHFKEYGVLLYNHDPNRLNSSYPVLPASTPAGLFALSLLGEDPNSGNYASVRDFIMERAPTRYRFTGDDDFVFQAKGNLYFWYYGTLALFRCGGDSWNRWNAKMKETLLPAQESDGSWRPISLYAEYAGDTNRDRSYTTAMNVLTLEVYYRYFTPLLKVH